MIKGSESGSARISRVAHRSRRLVRGISLDVLCWSANELGVLTHSNP